MARGVDISGVVLVDKPVGPTSFDVVKRVRHLFHVKSAGHTGTLDPNASGLLVVCLGDATRIATFLTEGEKAYEGVVRFGVTTDTLDPEGRVLEERDASGLTQGAIETALAGMLGTQLQTVPMYSARKVDGKRLYELAREGKDVERAQAEITILDARLTAWDPPDATIFVRCSKGTYIRSIAQSLGEAVGTGAHLKSLRRLASGSLDVRDAATLERLEADAATGTEALHAHVRSVETALADLPAVQLDTRWATSVSFGNALDPGAHAALKLPPQPRGRKLRLVDPEGLVVAVGESDGAGTIRLLRVLRARVGPGTHRR